MPASRRRSLRRPRSRSRRKYDTEEDFDFWFVEASSDGTNFTPVLTDHSSPASQDQSGINSSGKGIDGSSGGNYVTVAATLPAGTTHVRLGYTTDPGLVRPGLLADDITVDGTLIGGAEDGEAPWTLAGFSVTTGVVTTFHFIAYVAENRQYVGYDNSLQTVYNFGFLNTKSDWVEYHPYENGLLISYWDETFNDNNVGDHPGGGLILPIDAHPTFFHSQDGWLLRPRILSYDSTFGLEPTTAITVNRNSLPTSIASQPAVPVFDDTETWWSASDADGTTPTHVGRYQPGWYGTNPPKTGTTIAVKSTALNGAVVQVQVNGSEKASGNRGR